MAKALELNTDTLSVVPSIPQAARVRTSAVGEKQVRAAKIEREPLQVRWPVEDVKAVKLAAIQMDYPTVSDFMLACFHDFMQKKKA